MTALERLRHVMVRLHQLKLHFADWAICGDWECELNRAELARLTAEQGERDT